MRNSDTENGTKSSHFENVGCVVRIPSGQWSAVEKAITSVDGVRILFVKIASSDVFLRVSALRVATPEDLPRRDRT